jgi:hypothetical protein
MRLRLTLAIGALVLVPLASGATGLRVTLKAPAANPKVDVKWWYTIVAKDPRGKPVRARLTAQVVDPFGGVHPIDYGPSKPEKPITNRPFTGTFRDYITFPSSSRGFTLTLRWTVRAKLVGTWRKHVLTRKVTPG